MKKVLILCLHRPGRSPSQRFRIEQYLAYLKQHGYSFHFSYLLSEEDDKVYYSAGKLPAKMAIILKSIFKRVSEIFRAGKYDLVFVQREAFMLGTAFFEKTIGKKVPMIFDFDDSIWLQNVSEANKKFGFLKDASKTAKIISSASMVFAGNEYLANYARNYNANVEIIPTTIDTDIYKKQEVQQTGKVCIGWSGSFSTIEHFETAIPALLEIRNKYGSRVSFKIIGDKNYYSRELEVQGLPWNASSEVKDLSEFDVGIMPLPDTEWAKGKCGLKGLQYMALGIPTLMSPVGVNSRIIAHGVNGFLPKSKEDWVRDLSILIENPAERERIGEEGRQTVLENYSVKAWEKKYLELFDRLTNTEN